MPQPHTAPPPFRAGHIGSLLRPRTLHVACRFLVDDAIRIGRDVRGSA